MKLFRPLFGFLLSVLLLPTATQAQVVTTQPSPFRDTDAVTIIFDATQGNAGLKDFTGDVYIYTGVVTESATGTTWSHVKSSNFGTGDPASKMTRSATNPNLYTITITPRTFYPGVLASEKIYRLGMLFKNADGSKVGRTASGGDIFVDVAQDAFNLRFTNPSGTPPFFLPLNTPTPVTVATSAPATITLFLNGNQIAQQANATSLTAQVTITQAGANTLRATATDGTNSASTEIQLQARPAVTTAPLPAGAKPDGVTYLNGGTSVIISLTAPRKQFVYVVGDFNNWQPTAAGFMQRTTDTNAATAADAASGRWWVQIDGLTPGQEYGYQFLVDGSIRVADPYGEKILDPSDDPFIPEVTYPAAQRQYPTGKTTGLVSVLQTNQTPYVFKTTNFQRPARPNMVVYELLVRDFVARHDYQTLSDTLSYLQRLGVNTIELMPVNEFDGNINWGYSPDFYFTPDKYYGTRLAFKQFIDECHRRSIAVVLDMVLNHSTGQSPLVQLYPGSSAFVPGDDNPWFNVTAKHPYNVYNDLNHESPYTRYFSKRVMEYWLREYHVDGYRFDLAGGFSQVQKSEATYGAYDQSRVDIWKDYYQTLVAADATSYPILEHFPEDLEAKTLTDYGFMIWGNMNSNYNEATMGYNENGKSDLSRGYYKTRGFAQPNLITYMESHDEERLAYKNRMYGNTGPDGYSTKMLATSMARNELAAAFFFTVPGPKMIWQFGEVGYDYSINVCADGTTVKEDCRTGPKPIRWDYYQEPSRRHLYDVYRSLITLKETQPVFANPTTYDQQVSGSVKTIHLADANLSVTVVGNFNVAAATVVPAFQSAGTWYNYLTGTALTVTDVNAPLPLQAGEYAVYTSKRISRPSGTLLAARAAQATTALHLSVAPNPTAGAATLRYELPTPAATVSITVSNVLGQRVRALSTTGRQAAGAHELSLPVSELANGVYLVRLLADGQPQTTRLVVQH